MKNKTILTLCLSLMLGLFCLGVGISMLSQHLIKSTALQDTFVEVVSIKIDDNVRYYNQQRQFGKLVSVVEATDSNGQCSLTKAQSQQKFRTIQTTSSNLSVDNTFIDTVNINAYQTNKDKIGDEVVYALYRQDQLLGFAIYQITSIADLPLSYMYGNNDTIVVRYFECVEVPVSKDNVVLYALPHEVEIKSLSFVIEKFYE